jgi:inorganic pyrophosphatase
MDGFWSLLDQLVATSRVVVDRPGGKPHPRYPDLVYPLDYGYLEGTTSGDGDGIDIWLGASGAHTLSAVLMTVDLEKRDAELKLLLGCTEEETRTILAFHNDMFSLRATLVRRPEKE